VPAQRQLLRLVDDPHATAADLAQDLVVPQLTQVRNGGRGCRVSCLARSVVRRLGSPSSRGRAASRGCHRRARGSAERTPRPRAAGLGGRLQRTRPR
jgi:hypothetical protein